MAHSDQPPHFERLTHPQYRSDIDGLRAVAVLAVVMFHAFPEWMPGGFIGVDIFFVISGFLISTILYGSLERGGFSFIEFYSRRIRRIFPALIVVLIASLGLGWIILLQDEYRQLGKHVSGGAAFLSNFILWGESGYFDSAAASKPLLHLWSLAIEEQFYIFFPMMLWFAWKRRFNLFAVTAVIALISFSMGMAAIQSDQAAAFYFPHLRFWELMSGALLAHATLRATKNPAGQILDRGAASDSPIDRPNAVLTTDGMRGRGWFGNGLSLAGMGLIGAGLLAITKETSFPGAWALLPNLGAVLVIAGGASAWVNRGVLSSRPLVWVGLISYPLYLWHWVLLSFARILAGDVPSWKVRLSLVVLSIVLSWFTYRFVETPLRFGQSGKTKAAGLALAMLIVCAAGAAVHFLDGVPHRFVATHSLTLDSGAEGGFAGTEASCAVPGKTDSKLKCHQDRREPPRYALLGDSKAIALAPGAFRTSLAGGRWIFVGNDDFHPQLAASMRSVPFPSNPATEAALEEVARKKSVEYVVLAVAARRLFRLAGSDSIDDLPESTNYDIALMSLQSVASRWIAAGKKVVLVVDNPTLPAPEDCLTRKTPFDALNDAFVQARPDCRLDLNRYLRQREQYMKVLAEIKRRHPGDVDIFDATEILCDRKSGVCPAVRNGRVLYGFTDHISDHASGLVGRELNAFLSRR